MHVASLLAFIAVVSFASGALPIPAGHMWQWMTVARASQPADYWLAASIRKSTEGSPVLLPPERITAHWKTFSGGERIWLEGGTADRTVLQLSGLPVSAKISGGHTLGKGSGEVRCGKGPAACRIDGHLVLSNLTLIAESLPANFTGEK